jgi:methyl-accepting chemotaxis protein
MFSLTLTSILCQRPIKQRLGAIIVAFALPLLVLGAIVILEKYKDIRFSQKEIAGLTLLDQLFPILIHLVTLQKEGMIHTHNLEHRHNEQKFQQTQEIITKTIELYSAEHKELAGFLPIDQKGLAFWHRSHLTTQALMNQWQPIAETLKNPSLENFQHASGQITALITLVNEHINHVNDSSNLLLDMDMDSVYLMENVSYELPEMIIHIYDTSKAVFDYAALKKSSQATPEELKEGLKKIEKSIPILIETDLNVIQSNNDYALFGDPLFYGSTPGLAARTLGDFQKLDGATRAYTDALTTFHKQEDIQDLDHYLALSTSLKEAVAKAWVTQRQDLKAIIHTRLGHYYQQITLYVGLCGSALFIGLWLFFALVRTVTAPLADLEQAMGRLAARDLATTIPGTDRRDEIGIMARTVMVFKENAVLIDQLSNNFRHKIDTVYQQVLATIQETQIAAESMNLTATRNANHANHLGNSIITTTTSLQTAAAASEEMVQAVEAITQQLQMANVIVDTTQSATNEAATYMSHLQQATDDITTVVASIHKLTEQTKLLSINASIEAAKAGEAGRGFTVVADEVKSLAQETAAASSAINDRVQNIKTLTNNYFAVMQTVTGSVDQLNTASDEIVHAVTDQRQATAEMARTMDVISTTTSQLTNDVEGILNGTNLTQEIAVEVNNVTKTLAAMSFELEMALGDYAQELAQTKPKQAA